jgi:hypothetical protein
MKKFLKLLSVLAIRGFQIILLFFAYDSFEKSDELGHSVREFDSYVPALNENDVLMNINSNSVAISSGFNGGAVAMSLITCTCLFLVVWIELSMYQRRNENKVD